MKCGLLPRRKRNRRNRSRGTFDSAGISGTGGAVPTSGEWVAPFALRGEGLLAATHEIYPISGHKVFRHRVGRHGAGAISRASGPLNSRETARQPAECRPLCGNPAPPPRRRSGSGVGGPPPRGDPFFIPLAAFPHTGDRFPPFKISFPRVGIRFPGPWRHSRVPESAFRRPVTRYGMWERDSSEVGGIPRMEEAGEFKSKDPVYFFRLYPLVPVYLLDQVTPNSPPFPGRIYSPRPRNFLATSRILQPASQRSPRGYHSRTCYDKYCSVRKYDHAIANFDPFDPRTAICRRCRVPCIAGQRDHAQNSRRLGN